jgi:hypothetical protein
LGNRNYDPIAAFAPHGLNTFRKHFPQGQSNLDVPMTNEEALNELEQPSGVHDLDLLLKGMLAVPFLGRPHPDR